MLAHEVLSLNKVIVVVNRDYDVAALLVGEQDR